jgi:hypothetical protein
VGTATRASTAAATTYSMEAARSAARHRRPALGDQRR